MKNLILHFVPIGSPLESWTCSNPISVPQIGSIVTVTFDSERLTGTVEKIHWVIEPLTSTATIYIRE